MVYRGNLLCKLVLAVLVMANAVVPAFAEEAPALNGAANLEAARPDTDHTEETGEEATDEVHVTSSLSAGYRIVDVNGFGGRGAEFDYLHSGPHFGVSHSRLSRKLKYFLDGSYLNEKDYHGELLLDHQGEYRFSLLTESFFHNLDRELLFEGFNEPAAGLPAYIPVQSDSLQPYGIRVEQDAAAFRYKPQSYPMHLNLGYWRMLKQGTRQLIFADQAFQGAPNTVYAQARPVNRQTHEGSFGLDSHMGPVDFIYLFRIRQFEDNAAIPADTFIPRSDFGGNLLRNGGIQQHNEDPNSRFMSHTVKLHTSLSGGIVGAASYTYGKRENLSRLTDIVGADQTTAVVQNAAADLVYTPCKEFSLSLKYRLQQVDNENPAFIQSRFAPQPELEVRPSLDVTRNTVLATASFRPHRLLSLIGEYQGDFIERDNLAAGATPQLRWRDLPERTDTHKGTLTIVGRPLKGLRLKALYSYSATDTPSYGSSFEQKHEGKFLATYKSTNRWGLTAGYQTSKENNDGIRLSELSLSTFAFSQFPSPLSRSKEDNRVSAGLWFTPLDKLTVTGSYSFLRSSIDQTVLLTAVAPAIADAATFTSQAHIYSISSVYHLNEKLDLSVLLQQVRSFSEFDPALLTSARGDSAGIREISRTKTLESSVSARSDYRITGNVSCIFDYSFRDYSDEANSSLDGTVQTYMVFLNAKW